MPRPRPLPDAIAARRTLVHRFGPRADRLKQLFTRFGLRSRRVFLVWVQSTGEAVGEGSEVIVARIEILPTPEVSDATGVSRRPISIGEIPDGSLRVTGISAAAYTEDNLRGKSIPQDYSKGLPVPNSSTIVGGTVANPIVPQPYDFFYEVVEDGRGDDPAARTRFALLASPWRREGGLQWGVWLQPASGATDRTGATTLDVNDIADD